MGRLFVALVAVSAVTFIHMASAADLGPPVYKAPPPAPAPVWSWTGLYIGINGGGGISHNRTTDTFVRLPGGVVEQDETFTHSPAGGVFGGQIGYNWQFDPHWVGGIEGDWQWTGQSETNCLMSCGQAFFGGPPGNSLTDEQKLQWIATARARFGYADGGWLWYVTGGGAWGKIDQNLNYGAGAPEVFTAASFSTTRGGWTVGGGVETALWNSGWSAKLEYLYVDLGTVTNTFTLGAVPEGPAIITSSSKIQDNIFRVGLNYRFR
jgi:outer membrane immunogenic protein